MLLKKEVLAGKRKLRNGSLVLYGTLYAYEIYYSCKSKFFDWTVVVQRPNMRELVFNFNVMNVDFEKRLYKELGKMYIRKFANRNTVNAIGF